MFPIILKELRQSKNPNQKQFAEAIYISPSAVSQYETGHTMPSRETLDRIARYFNVSTDYLLGTSRHAEIEKAMNQEYCLGVTVSTLLDKCMRIKGSHRETLLDIVESLLLRCEITDTQISDE